jgi:hypothetical protein
VGKSFSRNKNTFDFTAADAEVKDSATGITQADYDALGDAEKAKYHKDDADGKYYKNKANANAVNSDIIQKSIQNMQRVASCEQEVVTKVTSEYMAQVKFAIAQAKKLWTSAAAWSSTEHKEAYEYYDALGECAAEQVYQNFEAIRG